MRTIINNLDDSEDMLNAAMNISDAELHLALLIRKLEEFYHG